MAEERELKVSFLSKNKITCPLCSEIFHREELLSGSGRLIAGTITDELHRLYEPSMKYGDVYPLVYQATVCPKCWYAAMDKDFVDLPKDGWKKGAADAVKRMADAKLIFPDVDFHEVRTLKSGAASQYLVTRCYDYFPKEFSPTIKQGIAALRTGWLLDELHNKFPGEHYDWLSGLFKRKAQFFYTEALEREQNQSELLSGIKNCGPDTDKNYAYEGAIYLAGLLTYKYGSKSDSELREKQLSSIKVNIARIFGLGKASKNKPGPLLEHAKTLYTNINKELHESD
ncbi:MAG: DUF2225 domain-containing protein [Treponema sp.]|jgi:uncharacterized protein (DUF2225 family)|nr:DUF2225 domain-containing protein [Treponema sp.]